MREEEKNEFKNKPAREIRANYKYAVEKIKNDKWLADNCLEDFGKYNQPYQYALDLRDYIEAHYPEYTI